MSDTQLANFWKKVDKTGACWLWVGATFQSGYGLYVVDGKKYRAHRLAWMITAGAIPFGLCVCHNCPGGDNRLCVNPSHLWLGTPADNNNDRNRKGRTRAPVGERQHLAKLTDDAVRDIRRKATMMRGEQVIVARQYGVSVSLISMVRSGKRWTHINV